MNPLALAAAVCAFPVAALAAPETFNIDPAHSAPRFEYSHFGYTNQLHSFDKISGRIILDRATHIASVDVTIDAKSVNTGFALFNGHLQGEDYFDTAKYPTINFTSTRVRFDGDKPVAVEGDLTLKGVTRPVTLTVTSFLAKPHPALKKDAIGATATATIKRSDFNMGKNVPYVSDEVALTLPIEAIKE